MGVEEVTSGQAQTEPQSLPAGWARATIGEILTFEYGKSLVKANRAESGEYPVYGSSGIVGFHTEHLIKQPAIIVGRKGAAGAVHLCKKDSWPIDTTYFVKVNNSLSTDFIFYLLKFCRLQKYESSTAIPGLNRDHAYSEKVSLPPLSEQQRIVAKIEELFSELDKGVENLRTAQQQLKVYRQALINEALNPEKHRNSIVAPFSALIGKINQGWSPKCDLNRRALNDEWAIIKTTAVQPMQYSQEECKPLPESFEPRPDIEIKAGDFLMTRKGPRNRTGVACLVEETRSKSMLCDTVYRFRCDETKVYPKYLELVLNSPAVVAELDRRKSGISDSGISLNHSKLKNLPIPLIGTVSEQKNLVDEINQKLEEITRLETEISHSLLKSEALRQSILKKAFSGQLVPQDPNDEPASVLLERLYAERAAQPKARGRKAKAPA